MENHLLATLSQQQVLSQEQQQSLRILLQRDDLPQ